jgi:hypothetical protein
MRKIEVLYTGKDIEMIFPFKSVRCAFSFVRDSLDEPFLVRSREDLNRKMCGEWIVAGACCGKTFLCREVEI